MTGFGERYVIDTNALTQLRRRRRSTAFFRESAVIPGEVLSEAEGFPDLGTLQQNRHPTTARTLEWLVKVMETVPADDRMLVDLYANKGGADPLVIACALEGREWDSRYIDAPEWIVVTDDGAVRNKAEEFGLRVLSNTEFAAIVDAAESAH